MKCDLVLHAVSYTVLPNVPILAALLDSYGLVEEDGDWVEIDEAHMSETLLFVLDSAREYYQLQVDQHGHDADDDCAFDVKYRAYYQRVDEALVKLAEAMSDRPDITPEDWAEIEAICAVPDRADPVSEEEAGSESEAA